MIGDPVSVLARSNLTRAYVLSADSTYAREQYREFIFIWRDADPDLPILQQAKIHYEKLQ